ncbi:MAG TPA: OpgC domain-containing protein [Chloroflexota bacterium]|nr:OpgC domain-containing protein [Chloroflexota bacterium]
MRLPLAVKWPRLSYVPATRRDLRLDFLRGFCALAMIVDHIGGASWLYALTGGNRFYTSAAEGFVFISGLVVGLVYRELCARAGLGPALHRLLVRAAQLYLLAVGLTLVFLPASELLGLPWAQGVDLSDPAAFVVSVLTLHRTYYVVDIPLLYALLLGITPLALVLLHEGRTGLLLGLSWGLWALYQVFPDQADMPWPIAGNYAFHFSAWQALYFTAVVLGYHRARISAALRDIPRWPALVIAGTAFLLLVDVYRRGDALWRLLPADRLGDDVTELFVLLFGKGDLRPGRLLAFAVVFAFSYLVVDRLWAPLHRLFGGLLLPLGQNALYAYSLHVLFVGLYGALALWLPPLTASERLLKTFYTAVQLGLVALTWAAIRARVLLDAARDWRFALGAPAAAALACLLVLPLDPTPTLPGWGHAAAEAAAPADPRLARVFGTPVPREGSRRVPEFAEHQSLIRRPGAASSGREAPRVSPYVGAIRGTLRQQLFYSSALDAEMPYFVYLPPDYDTAGRRYPVLYLLHGAAASNEEWLAYGVVDEADRMIVDFEIHPLIIVFPQGDYSYWVNHVDGPRWGDYVAVDLVRHVDATFRTLPLATRRGIGGLSMGGHGALQLAFTHPQVFGVVGAHSPSLREDDGDLPFLGTGDEWAQRDPVTLAQRARRIEHLKVWIDVGQLDPYYERAEQLAERLSARGLELQWHADPDRDHGDWQLYVADYLRFYDYALNAR